MPRCKIKDIGDMVYVVDVDTLKIWPTGIKTDKIIPFMLNMEGDRIDETTVEVDLDGIKATLVLIPQ